MTDIEHIDKRIERLQKEQAITAATFDSLSAQLRQAQTRYAQQTGAIEELKTLRISLNGTTTTQ